MKVVLVALRWMIHREELPDQTYPSAANKYRPAVQLASELGELPIAAIKQGAGLAVGGVVVIDQRC